MLKKCVLPLAGSLLLMLFLPFLLSRGWTAPLGAYMQKELPGSVALSGIRDDMSEVSVKVLRSDTNVVEDIPLFDYLCGVVSAEMSPEFELEALKAQAVAACSYMVYRREGELSKPGLIEEHHGAYVCTDYRHCKAYLPKEEARLSWGEKYFNRNYPKIEAAVNSVLGEIIVYDGAPANAVFHSISAGQTESAEEVWGLAVPYLVSVESYCDASADGYESEVALDKDEFFQKISAFAAGASADGDPEDWVGDAVRTQAGGIKNIEVCGVTLTGEQMRSLFALRSANFDLTYADGVFSFSVRGYGHGVGMSQYGANELAKSGMDYKEILKTYYTGVEIVQYDFPSP